MKTKVVKIFLVSVVSSCAIVSVTSCKKKNETNVVCTYDGEKFDWTSVDNTSKYELAIKDGANEENYSSKDSEFTYDLKNESAELKINALDEKGKSVYDSSIPFSFSSIGVFETPVYNYGTISWNAVANATSYLVKIGDEVNTTTNTFYELNPGVNNDVSVKPVLDVSKVTDGKYYTYSVPMNYEVMATPAITTFDKDSKTITWNPVKNAGGYYLKIELDGAIVAEQGGIGANSTYYNDYAFTTPGVYTVSLATKKNNNSDSFDSKFYEKKIVRLTAPKNLTVEETNGGIVLKWDKVNDANKYRIQLPNGSSVETSELYYKFISESKDVEENYNFKVYSASTESNVLDSLEYATENVVKLGIVKNIKIQGRMITWDIVDKAQGYVISIDGTEINIDKNEYYFDGYTGSHNIKIKARGNGSTIISSEYSLIQQIYKLSKPTNLSISNGILKWDSVSNAKSYKIILTNGVSDSYAGSYTATTNSILINRSDLKESQTILVQAIGDGLTIADSEMSDPYNTYVLPAPVVSVTTEGVVWSKVLNAVSYTISIGDFKKNVTGNSLNLSENDIEAGIYTIVVVANGDLEHYFNSDESKAISLKLLAKPEVSDNETLSGVTWKRVTSSFNYQVRLDSNTIESVGNNTTTYDVKFNTAGVHTVSVRAVGDGIETVTSGWTTIQIDVAQLMAPTSFSAQKENQKLIINAADVENAVGYKFKVGGVVYESTNNYYEITNCNSGDYVISVAAIGSGYKYIDSSFCEEKTITILNTPSKINFSKEDYQTYLLSWTPVNKAVSYTIEITKTYSDGTTSTTSITVTKTEIEIDTNDVVSISGKIIANGNKSTSFDSPTKEIEAITIK